MRGFATLGGPKVKAETASITPSNIEVRDVLDNFNPRLTELPQCKSLD